MKNKVLRRADVAVTLTLTTLLLADQPLAQTYRASSSTPDDHGRATFIEKGCADCHAIYGRGVGGVEPEGGPDLGKRDIYGTYLELAADMWNHFPDMLKRVRKANREFPSFTEDEVGEIVTFLSFIRYVGEPGNERSGRKLLREKRCTACHTFGGKGGDVGPDFAQSEDYLSPLALAAAMWNHGPGMQDLFEKHDIERPSLNGREMIDLSVGIKSFMSPSRVPPGSFVPGDPEVGRTLASEKGCLQCHALSSDADAIGFAEMELDASLTEIAGHMWNHGPDMWEMMEDRGIAFPSLTRREMADLIAYVYSLRLNDPPGDPGRGADLIVEKGCTSCHAEGGKETAMAVDFANVGDLDSPLTMISRMWNHAEDMDEAVRETNKRWPQFEGRDLADIHAYLLSLPRSAHD